MKINYRKKIEQGVKKTTLLSSTIIIIIVATVIGVTLIKTEYSNFKSHIKNFKNTLIEREKFYLKTEVQNLLSDIKFEEESILDSKKERIEKQSIIAFNLASSLYEKTKNLSKQEQISFIKTSKSFRSIVREHHKVELQKNYIKLFIKGFLLNFINIGVLLGWLGFIVIGTSITTSKNGVVIFITTMIVSYFLTDLIKIAAAKRLKKKLTPKRIFKTKKIVALVILGFGLLLLSQGLFPELYEKSKTQIEKVNPIN